MGNSLRCCLACILPCGALDVILVVHIDGQVDQYSHPILAADVLSGNPNHILTEPTSDSAATARRKPAVVSPGSDLRRGHIYFLVPLHPPSSPSPSPPGSGGGGAVRKTKRTVAPVDSGESRRRRRSGRVGAWRQQLESISEDF